MALEPSTPEGEPTHLEDFFILSKVLKKLN